MTPTVPGPASVAPALDPVAGGLAPSPGTAGHGLRAATGTAVLQTGGPQSVLAVTLGLLFALGTFLVLRRDVVRVVWGVAIISQAANLYLVTMGGVAGVAPVGKKFDAPPTDPLVQALVLTAIVIGFGTTAFALVLTYRVYEEHGTLDTDELGEMDDADDPESGPDPDPVRSAGGGHRDPGDRGVDTDGGAAGDRSGAGDPATDGGRAAADRADTDRPSGGEATDRRSRRRSGRGDPDGDADGGDGGDRR